MDPVRRCPDHDFFAGDGCPDCGREGEAVLSGERRRRLSKFLSGALRHVPDDAGIDLDERGWADADDLVAAAGRQYDWADRGAVAGVVATDPKGRYEVARRTSDDPLGDRIRAAYGHSVDVDIDGGENPDDGGRDEVPDVLYHSTAPRNLDAIREEGLRPMDRQRVHLSGSIADAREVGRRHADDPAVLALDVDALRGQGHEVAKRGAETYVTDRVPPAVLERVE